jgi:hypothetical protein
MVSNPKQGQLVRIVYRQSLHSVAAYHGKTGRVLIRARGKPRNHGLWSSPAVTSSRQGINPNIVRDNPLA